MNAVCSLTIAVDALWGRLASCGRLEIRLDGGVTSAAQDAILPHKPGSSQDRTCYGRIRRVERLQGACRRLLTVSLLLSVSVAACAQWLNYPDPGIPRLKDGKPNLSTPAPRVADGKPALTGVWAHERTSIADFKRIFGSSYEAESQAALIGMELESVHKYGINILLYFKPGESPLRPEAEALMKQRAAERGSTMFATASTAGRWRGCLPNHSKSFRRPRRQ